MTLGLNVWYDQKYAIGAYIRSQDAFALSTEVFLQEHYRFSLAYDFTISDLQNTATVLIELMMAYHFYTKPEIKKSKISDIAVDFNIQKKQLNLRRLVTVVLIHLFCLMVCGQKARVMADQVFDMLRYHEAIGLYDHYYTESRDTLAWERKGIMLCTIGQKSRCTQANGAMLAPSEKNNKLLLQYAELLYIDGQRRFCLCGLSRIT
ncbi:MAG: hypothetical protein IPL55_08220 [Saprospiraceae bacterium]|nr:hypothetical protein [Saprospiraceae bacterium]